MLPTICVAGLLFIAPVTEDDRFVFQLSKEQARLKWQSAESYCKFLDADRIVWQVEDANWKHWRAEAEYCRRVWWEVDEAINFDGERGLTGLARLRDLIGDRDYRLGKLPPPWPIWLFREIE